MANLKSSKKDIRRTLKRTELNKPFKRNAQMFPKKIKKLVSTGSIKEALEMLPIAFKALDKAAKRNVIHKNTASRTKSRLAKLFPKDGSVSAKVTKATATKAKVKTSKAKVKPKKK